QDAPFGGAVEDEVDGPDFVRSRGPEQWLPLGQGHLFPFAPAHLQVRLLVQALNSLVVDHLTSLAEFEVDHADAVALMAIRQRTDHLAQLDIGVGPRFVSVSACAHPSDRQRPALTQFLADQIAHQLAPVRCAHHFFRRASLMTSFSSLSSASSFLSLPFSDSRSFSRLASGTLIPPNLLRQR